MLNFDKLKIVARGWNFWSLLRPDRRGSGAHEGQLDENRVTGTSPVADQARSFLHGSAIRAGEIRRAVEAYPGMELRAAYNKWKADRGEEVTPFTTRVDTTVHAAAARLEMHLRERVCTQPGCKGVQILEPVCSSCVEGKAGYRTKWTCSTCLHRELSKEELTVWMARLSSL